MRERHYNATTVFGLAEATGMAEDTIRQRIHRRQIAVERHDGRVIIPGPEVARIMKEVLTAGEDWMTTEQAAACIGVDRFSIRRMLMRGVLTGSRPGRQWRIKTESVVDLARWMRANDRMNTRGFRPGSKVPRAAG